ncbi:hypothetical protein OF83DRAFT_913646 [Amylostereum chailletii]|nr:hypothetical protein OF83DRAFT_913646 [Amylostereum chailletii]
MRLLALPVKIPLPCLLVCFYSTVMAHCKQVNITIDDTFGDPDTGAVVNYTPPGVWANSFSCPSCDGQPNPTKTTNGTWHSSIFDQTLSLDGSSNAPLNASISFTGVTVEVYCVTPPGIATDMQFFIDGEHVGDFFQSPGAGYKYRVLAYANQSLSNAPHTIVLQNGRRNGSASRAILDRIVYSLDDGDSSVTAPSPNTGAIIGGVIGGTALIALLALLAAFGARARNHPRVRRFTVELTGAYSTFLESSPPKTEVTPPPAAPPPAPPPLRVSTQTTRPAPNASASPPSSPRSKATPSPYSHHHGYPPTSPTGRSYMSAGSNAPLLPQSLNAAYISPLSASPASIMSYNTLSSIPNPSLPLKPNRRIGPDIV